MDPQSATSQTLTDNWRVHSELDRVHSVQAEHSDRLSRLERKLDETARMKSVWGGASPFPSILGGSTPVQAPSHQSSSQVPYRSLDEDPTSAAASLHLDAEEEPRRLAQSSRANSVRFDESANQGHWAHASRGSIDFVPRAGNANAGLVMSERSSSYKSDGRASSVHSIRSAASGRGSSVNLENGFSFGDSARSPAETPLLAPGLLLLGPVPAIIRCWMNTNFRHDALLYAAVCTGSHRSQISSALVEKIGCTGRVQTNDHGRKTIELQVFLPEAIPHPSASSRSQSPVPQLPTITVTFSVFDISTTADTKSIQIILGSDILQMHNADVMFSTNSVSLYDDERNKLSIPLVRPEDERTFDSLTTTSHHTSRSLRMMPSRERMPVMQPPIDGLGHQSKESSPKFANRSNPAIETSQSLERYRPPGVIASEDPATESKTSLPESPKTSRPASRSAMPYRPNINDSDTRLDNGSMPSPDDVPTRNNVRTTSTSAAWNNWRREGDTTQSAQPSQPDWSSAASKTKDSVQQRRDAGIKVLRPMKVMSRTLSSTSPALASPGDGRSRFFDEGKRRPSAMESRNGSVVDVGETSNAEQARGSTQNPVGLKTKPGSVSGSSLGFAWMNNATSKLVVSCRTRQLRNIVTTSSLQKKRKTISNRSPYDPYISNDDRHALFAPEVNDVDRQPSHSGSSSPSTTVLSTFGETHIASSPLRFGESSTSDLRTQSQTGYNTPSEDYVASQLRQSIDYEMADDSSAIAQSTQSPAKGPLAETAERSSAQRRSASPVKRSAADMDEENSRRTRRMPQRLRSDTESGNDKEITVDAVSASIVKEDPSAEVLTEQVSRFRHLQESPLKDGEKGYLVATAWLHRILARTTASAKDEAYSEDVLEGHIGPVNNASIVPQGTFNKQHLYFLDGVTPYVHIRPEVSRQTDYEIVNEPAWLFMLECYGLIPGQHAIVRFAHDTAGVQAHSVNIEYELSPLLLTIQCVQAGETNVSRPLTPPPDADGQDSPERLAVEPAVQIVASRQDRYQSFLAASKRAAGISMTNKVRVWRRLDMNTSGPLVAQDIARDSTSSTADGDVDKASPAPFQLGISQADFLSMTEGTDFEMVDMKDETNNSKYNGKANLALLGIVDNQILVLEEQARPGSDDYISDTSRKLAQTNRQKAKSADSGTSTPAGPVTRSRNKNSGRSRGSIGLVNLGNTCYMNSALQCISRIEELAAYFLSPKWKSEINNDNPLGYHGAMAKAFRDLLAGLYHEGANSAYRPSGFKSALSNAQAMFSGYGQQDSQEFLSFLVDALHEDLNRVLKKPYMENPDSDDARVHDPEYIRELGETYRSNHRARNDSIAMDLFNGFYKNTMVCPQCGKISVTFDPYSLLTLQLPIEDVWQHTVVVVPLLGRPSAHKLDMDKNASIKACKALLASKIAGLDATKLVVIEAFSKKVYKLYNDSESVSAIHSGDRIYVYELAEPATSIVTPRSQAGYSSGRSLAQSAMDLERAESMAVVVDNRVTGRSGIQTIGTPLLVSITREEAKNYDAILRKVLDTVARTTSVTLPGMTSASEDAQRFAKTTGSNISDSTMASDDDYVNVSKPERLSSRSSASAAARILAPHRYMFEMEYFDYTDNHINQQLEPSSRMDSRVRVPTPRDEFDVSDSAGTISSGPGRSTASSRASSPEDMPTSSSNSPPLIPNTNTNSHYFHGDVHSDDDLPTPEHIMRKDRNRGKFNKRGRGKQTTYGRKPRHVRQASPQANRGRNRSSEDSEYYIKLDEGIILNWTEDAWNALYGGTADSDSDKGHSLLDIKALTVTADADLEEKIARRARRKKEGITLDECFAETSKTETLSEENAWYCSRCKELRRADKTLELWTVPDILVIHLKRFSGERYRRDKVDVEVNFPIEGLDLSKQVQSGQDDKGHIYDLFAVDNHYGGLGGGHYTATAMNFFDEKWYDFNDHSVSATGANRAVSSAAYLLFYRRRTTAALGPPYLQELVEQSHAVSDEAGEASLDDRDPRSSRAPSRLPGSSSNGTGAGTAAARRARVHLETAVVDPRLSHEPGSREQSVENSVYRATGRTSMIDDEDLDAIDDEGIEVRDSDSERPPRYSGDSIREAQQGNWGFEAINSVEPLPSSDDELVDRHIQPMSTDEHLVDNDMNRYGSDNDVGMVVSDDNSSFGGSPATDLGSFGTRPGDDDTPHLDLHL